MDILRKGKGPLRFAKVQHPLDAISKNGRKRLLEAGKLAGKTPEDILGKDAKKYA